MFNFISRVVEAPVTTPKPQLDEDKFNIKTTNRLTKALSLRVLPYSERAFILRYASCTSDLTKTLPAAILF